MQYDHNCMGQRSSLQVGEKIQGRKYCTGVKDVRWRTVDCKVQIVRKKNEQSIRNNVSYSGIYRCTAAYIHNVQRQREPV